MPERKKRNYGRIPNQGGTGGKEKRVERRECGGKKEKKSGVCRAYLTREVKGEAAIVKSRFVGRPSPGQGKSRSGNYIVFFCVLHAVIKAHVCF